MAEDIVKIGLFNQDAAIIAVRFKFRAHANQVPPHSFTEVAVHFPHRVVPRITRQGGAFSIHPDPKQPLLSTSSAIAEMRRIVVPSEARMLLKAELSFYGINALSLFPDLDGLAEFTNWTIESKEYWRKVDWR